jgi:hypothetical protein
VKSTICLDISLCCAGQLILIILKPSYNDYEFKDFPHLTCSFSGPISVNSV